MPFETFSDRLQEVATKSLSYCRHKYGNNGVKTEEGIDDSISWRPTFYLKPGKHKIIAVEVDDVLYPNSLKGAAHEISHYDFPISVYQACSLEAYLNDPKQKRIAELRKHGFGIITVDEDGIVVVQSASGTLTQHIAPDKFEQAINSLTPSLKVSFRSAYDVYITDEGQGLQQAGQVVEAIIDAMATIASKKIASLNISPTRALADKIDDMYADANFKPHRAALGGARDFVKEFRNIASHAPKTAKDAAARIRKCRAGFLDAIQIAEKLRAACKKLGYTLNIHTA